MIWTLRNKKLKVYPQLWLAYMHVTCLIMHTRPFKVCVLLWPYLLCHQKKNAKNTDFSWQCARELDNALLQEIFNFIGSQHLINWKILTSRETSFWSKRIMPTVNFDFSSFWSLGYSLATSTVSKETFLRIISWLERSPDCRTSKAMFSDAEFVYQVTCLGQRYKCTGARMNWQSTSV